MFVLLLFSLLGRVLFFLSVLLVSVCFCFVPFVREGFRSREVAQRATSLDPKPLLPLCCFFCFLFCFVSCVSYFVLFLWLELCLLFWFLLVVLSKMLFLLQFWCFWCNVCSKHVFKFCFWIFFILLCFLTSCLLKRFSVLSFCQKKHNRLFACLDLALFFVHLLCFCL